MPKSIIKSPFEIFRIEALILLLIGLLAACRGGSPSDTADKGTGSAPVVRVQPAPPAPRFQVLSQDLGTTGCVLRLRWPSGVTPPDSPPTLAFCLPPGRQVNARWTAARLGDKPVPLNSPMNSPNPGTKPEAHGAQSPAAPFRENAGMVEFVGCFRHWPIYRLQLNKDIFDLLRNAPLDQPATDLKLTLELKWPQPAAFSPPSGVGETPGEASLRRVAENLVINDQALKYFVTLDLPAPSDYSTRQTDPRALAPGARPWARLAAARDGLVRLDPDELIKVGFSSQWVKPEAVRVFSHGRPVPVMVAPRSDLPKELKPGVYFWVQRGKGLYTADRAYWVTLGEDLPPKNLVLNLEGRRPSAEAASAETIERLAIRDEDKMFQTRHGSFLAIEGMEWVQAELAKDKPLDLALEFPAFVPRGQLLKGRLDFFFDREDSLGQVKIQVLAGGKSLTTLNFFSSQDQKKDFTLPEACVRDGRTTLTLRLLDDGSTSATAAEGGGLWFDRVQVSYGSAPQLVQARMTLGGDLATSQTVWMPLPDLNTEPKVPPLILRVGGAGEALDLWPAAAGKDGKSGVYWRRVGGERLEFFDARAIPDAPPLDPVQFDDLINEKQSADLLIITHQEFMDAAQKLAEFHRDEGLSARVVNVQNIYDTFSDGELSPVAIKSFLGYILRHWRQGAPGHVLLIGDSSSDYLGLARNNVRNWVPTYTYTNGSDKWASDYWFTTVAGEDDLGDFIIGRISVANRADAQTVVDKLIDYASNPRRGPWRSRLAYVSDDGEFPEIVDDLRRNYTPAAYGAERVFLSELPLEDNWYLPKSYIERKRMKVSRTATENILRTFRKGVAYLEYYGHGSPNIWADERIWFGGDSPNSDNQHLAGAGYETFIANMTCNSGAIDYPLTPWNICITEDMMRVAGGGAIACYVPSGPGVTTVHREMSKALRRAMFENGLRRMGEVTTLAKLEYALGRQPKELLYMYLLLGDPLLSLQLSGRRAQFDPPRPAYSPGDAVSFTLTGLTPVQGKWTGELSEDAGRILWSGEPADYDGGRLRFKGEIPADAQAGPVVLRFYCWNPAGEEDLVLAGRFMIQRPCLALDWIELTTPTQTSSPAPAPGRSISVKVRNPTGLEAQGELEVRLWNEGTSRSLNRQMVKLGAGQTQRFQVPLPSQPRRKPAVAEATLRLPAAPDDPALAQVMTKNTVAEIPPNWAGWIEPLSSLEFQKSNGSVILRAAAALPKDSTTACLAGIKSVRGEALTTQTLTPGLRGDQRAVPVIFNLDSSMLGKLSGGTLWLDRVTSSPRNARVRIALLPLDRIRRRESRLEIVPGSVRPRPERPTEGETVFVEFSVENAGDLDAEPSSVELLDRPPDKGGRQLPDNMQNGQKQLPRLAAGRRLPVTLRWDPIGNVGRRKIWIHLIAAYNGNTAREANQLVPLEVEALTKPRLYVGKIWPEATARDLEEHRLTLKAQIMNGGQTDAHRVMVSFYRSHLQTPENKLGETEVKRAPGGGSGEAVFVWNYDPLRDMIKGTQLPTPTVQVWLKGSTQRVSSMDEPASPTTTRR